MEARAFAIKSKLPTFNKWTKWRLLWWVCCHVAEWRIFSRVEVNMNMNMNEPKINSTHKLMKKFSTPTQTFPSPQNLDLIRNFSPPSTRSRDATKKTSRSALSWWAKRRGRNSSSSRRFSRFKGRKVRHKSRRTRSFSSRKAKMSRSHEVEWSRKRHQAADSPFLNKKL